MSMIFVTDKGRMCNNILQYGHLYAWGREHHRKTMSMRFAHKYPEFYISHTPWHNTPTYLLAKLAARLRAIPTVSFNSFRRDYTADLHTLESRRWVLATGWCIRFFDLFEKYRGEICQLFTFNEQVRQTVRGKLSSGDRQTVRLGVHIRRGDYATWCGGHYFFDDSQMAGFIKQFCLLMPKEKPVELYICGNDPKMDRQLYRKQFGTDRTHFPDGTPAEDLCLLSECDYLIGPPSTFTLVASMYRDTPLYWITDGSATLALSDFKRFDEQHRRFDGLYISGGK